MDFEVEIFEVPAMDTSIVNSRLPGLKFKSGRMNGVFTHLPLIRMTRTTRRKQQEHSLYKKEYEKFSSIHYF